MSTENKKVGVGVRVMLVRNGKVLLGRRHPDPEKAGSGLRGEGTWTMPGGKLEYGEGFEAAAKREVEKETGLKLKDVEVVCVNNDINEHAHFITIGLFADDIAGDPEVMEPDTIVEWQWFDLDALPKPLYFPSARVLENFKRKQFYIER